MQNHPPKVLSNFTGNCFPLCNVGDSKFCYVSFDSACGTVDPKSQEGAAARKHPPAPCVWAGGGGAFLTVCVDCLVHTEANNVAAVWGGEAIAIFFKCTISVFRVILGCVKNINATHLYIVAFFLSCYQKPEDIKS